MGSQALVIGSPIAHSRSPLLHNVGYKALGLSDWQYDRAEITAEQVPEFLAKLDPSVRGVSVTMPCKFAALEAADSHTKRAKAIGSANTLVRIDNSNSWRADNTDVDGIRGCFDELFAGGAQQALTGKVALIFGSGGTARPAIWACCETGVSQVIIINRRDRSSEFIDLQQYFPDVNIQFVVLPSFGVDSLDDYEAGERRQLENLSKLANVAINTIPAAATQAFAPLFADTPVVDVIYDPWPTLLVTAAEQGAGKVVGGYVMLAYQAFEQFEQFTGYVAPRAAMLAALLLDLGIQD
ncbi:MAG: shikimate dehydrogenase [Corynebacterium sp.]|nr:shikimate dehydrogenase [Corynebacterium sp.]